VRLSRLHSIFTQLSNCDTDGRYDEFDIHLIRFQSCWEQFIREYVLERTAQSEFNTLRPKRAQKNRILATYLSGRRSKREPNWAIPAEVLSFSQTMKMPEHPKILPIFGSTPWILDDLRHLRNFLAHRSEEAARKFLANCASPDPELRKFALEVVDPISGKKRYRHWFDEMEAIGSMLP
jgi:hypothetical protein